MHWQLSEEQLGGTSLSWPQDLTQVVGGVRLGLGRGLELGTRGVPPRR